MLMNSAGEMFGGKDGQDAAATIMQQLEDVDVDATLEKAEEALEALQDPEKRGKLINEMLDRAVDVVMSLLPKIHIDNLEGKSGDFSYAVGNIDLGGFKVKKEKVSLKINFEGADQASLQRGFELVSFQAWDMCCALDGLNFSYEQTAFPYLNGEGVAFANAANISLQLGFGIRWAQKKGGESGKEIVDVPQLYLTRRQVDIESLELQVEDSFFATLYNVLLAAFSNLVRTYVNDSIEEQIDSQTESFTGALDMMLTHELVKPWLASLAPSIHSQGKSPKLKMLRNAAESKNTKSTVTSDNRNSSNFSQGVTPKKLPLSSQRRTTQNSSTKSKASAPSSPNLPNHDAYYNFDPNSRRSQSPGAPGHQLASAAAAANELGAAFAQIAVIRSVLKSLKSGKTVPRNQVQQALFSALYTVDNDADTGVKQCLNEIHGAILKSDKKQVGVSHKIGGFFKNLTGSSPTPAAPQASAEPITSEERKQLIFGLGLALSPAKIQLPTLKVREFHKLCQHNRKEQDPNKLVTLKDLVSVTIAWFEINQKMIDELKNMRKKHASTVTSRSSRESSSSTGSPKTKAAPSTTSADPGSPKVSELIESDKLKSVCQNLNICQDALTKIKMDLMQSTQLRERRQLETIILHLLDAIRCQTDGSDIMYDISEAKGQVKRNKSPMK